MKPANENGAYSGQRADAAQTQTLNASTSYHALNNPASAIDVKVCGGCELEAAQRELFLAFIGDGFSSGSVVEALRRQQTVITLGVSAQALIGGAS